MEKQTTAYRLETEMRVSFDKNPTRTLKCLIGAAVAIKNNAKKFCTGRIYKIRRADDFINLTIEKGSLIISYGQVFGYEFLYDEAKDTFNVSGFVSSFFNPTNPLPLAEVKTLHEEIQNEINHDAYLTRWIKAVIDCALMPNDDE